MFVLTRNEIRTETPPENWKSKQLIRHRQIYVDACDIQWVRPPPKSCLHQTAPYLNEKQINTQNKI